MTDSFWADGAEAYESGLRTHYDALLKDLRTQLSECTEESQRENYRSRIAQVESEYRSKLADIDNLLF